MAQRYPSAAGQTLAALDFWLGPTFEVALIAGTTNTSEFTEMQRTIYDSFIPNKVVAIRAANLSDADLPGELALIKGKPARGGQPTAYICEHGTCGMPRVGAAALAQALSKK